MKKRILVIDGDFFANRAIFSLDKKMRDNGQELTLSTIPEMKSFSNELSIQFSNLIKSFHNEKVNLIDGIIFVADYKSWRKEVPVFNPYYLDDSPDINVNYKANRAEKREESIIDWDNYRLTYNEFIDDLDQIVSVLKVKGLEGDDVINLLSEKYENNKDVEFLVFCTDGDLKQCVTDNFLLYRNIRSKAAPNGEFCVSRKMYENLYEKTALSVMMGNSQETSEYNKLFRIQISSPYSVERSLNKGIEIATPNIIALIKSICGDKKDNIFPIIRWTASTGTCNYGVTEKHVKKVLNLLGHELTDEVALRCMTENKLLISLLANLKVITKQTFDNETFKRVGQHLLHNFKLIRLNSNYLPENYLNDFNEMFELKAPMFLLNDESFDAIMLMGNKNRSDAANDLLNNSVPIIDSNTGDILASLNKK